VLVVFLIAVIEQGVNITFYVKVGKTPTENYEVLRTVNGDEVLNRSSVSEWFKRFKDGREDLQDDASNGCPSTYRNADTISNVREMVIRDRPWLLRMMADDLYINKQKINRILHEDVGKR
jgi:hypothetical protein